MWLLKTEPSTYAWADLVRDGRTRWDGVRNATALRHLRAMRPGDPALLYHTGTERAVVGLARVLSLPYPDPRARDPRLLVVDLAPVRPLPRPVTLTAIKAEPSLRHCALVRQPRLSVMPIAAAEWQTILSLAEAGGAQAGS